MVPLLVEGMFDRKELYLLWNFLTNMFDFVVATTDQHKLEQKLSPSSVMCVKDLNGKQLFTAQPARQPFRRIIAFHAYLAIENARAKGWNVTVYPEEPGQHHSLTEVATLSAGSKWPLPAELALLTGPRSSLDKGGDNASEEGILRVFSVC